MARSLPSGTVTFLFTDVAGSTRLLHALGPDAYAAALAEHRRVLREACSAQGGIEVDTQGDAFFMAFATAPDAAEAAVRGAQRLADGPIRVRMGLHTGTPTVTAEGYVGIDVHLGARVAALAHGGQIILSPATAALLGGHVLRDLGQHRLKDFDGATRLSQLGSGEFPPLRTPGSVELPSPATRFVGRERELFEAVSLVYERDPRVLSVLGPGGAGKTRFTLELARLLADDAEGGTVFVPLAPLRDADLVLPAVAERLGAVAGEAEAIAARVGGKRTHVICDNLEHLLPGAARPLADLVAAAPELRLLATSREALRIHGEAELDLPPLADDEALALFCERAQAVRPDVQPSAAVSELCERLDRLPLALELAAARTKLLTPEALLERLGIRLDVLKGTRDADERHTTLRATIAWSYDLLNDEEKRLFASLAVFRAGCTLESAETVCTAEIDTLASLLDKSLIRRRTGPAGEERYWMLETIREFALEQLDALREADELHRRHAKLIRDLARSAHLSSEDVVLGADFELAHRELEDIRAALDWTGLYEQVLAAEIFCALEQLWVTHALGEGRRRADALLEARQVLPPALRASLLRSSGGLCILHGDVELGEQRYREAIELFRELGDDYNVVGLLGRFAVHAGSHGEPAEAERLVAEVRELNENAHNPFVEPQMLTTLGNLAYRDGDFQRARDLHRRSVEAAAASGLVTWELWELASVAEVELRLDLLREAESTCRRALELARRLRDRICRSGS
jgi:predicted ATPase/class 3 adenylate cyclase